MVNVIPENFGIYPCPNCNRKDTTFSDTAVTTLFCIKCHKMYVKN
jgi:ribosomal protein S27E